MDHGHILRLLPVSASSFTPILLKSTMAKSCGVTEGFTVVLSMQKVVSSETRTIKAPLATLKLVHYTKELRINLTTHVYPLTWIG